MRKTDKKKPEVQVGQIIYVEYLDWLNQKSREPRPFEGTKINTKSIYAKSKDDRYEHRFDKKTWTAKSALGTEHIWLSTKDYWNAVKSMQDKEALRLKIAKELPNLSLEQLQEIAKSLKI